MKSEVAGSVVTQTNTVNKNAIWVCTLKYVVSQLERKAEPPNIISISRLQGQTAPVKSAQLSLVTDAVINVVVAVKIKVGSQ